MQNRVNDFYDIYSTIQFTRRHVQGGPKNGLFMSVDNFAMLIGKMRVTCQTFQYFV